jgi:hypothetical protein
MMMMMILMMMIAIMMMIVPIVINDSKLVPDIDSECDGNIHGDNDNDDSDDDTWRNVSRYRVNNVSSELGGISVTIDIIVL